MAPGTSMIGSAEETGIRQLIVNGKFKTALDRAKELHKARGSAASEALLIDAYAARIQSLLEQNLALEAKCLLELVRERFPAARARLDELSARSAARSGALEELLAPLNDPELSAERRAAIEQAVQSGVCGSGGAGRLRGSACGPRFARGRGRAGCGLDRGDQRARYGRRDCTARGVAPESARALEAAGARDCVLLSRGRRCLPGMPGRHQARERACAAGPGDACHLDAGRGDCRAADAGGGRSGGADHRKFSRAKEQAGDAGPGLRRLQILRQGRAKARSSSWCARRCRNAGEVCRSKSRP